VGVNHKHGHASSGRGAVGAPARTRLRRFRVQLASQHAWLLTQIPSQCARLTPTPTLPPFRAFQGEGAHHPRCKCARTWPHSAALHLDMTSRSLALVLGAWAGPPFPFSVSPKRGMERREAPPADRRRLANPKPGFAARHGRSPVTRGCRFRARWPSDVGPRRPRALHRDAIVGHRILLALRRRDRRHREENKDGTTINSYRTRVNPRENR
jgi:hypothetical protein